MNYVFFLNNNKNDKNNKITKTKIDVKTENI